MQRCVGGKQIGEQRRGAAVGADRCEGCGAAVRGCEGGDAREGIGKQRYFLANFQETPYPG
jgi:hypothetical protein